MQAAWHDFLVWVGVIAWHLYLVLVKLGIIKPRPVEFKIGGKMDLQKPFDAQALISALKAAGITDAEKLVNDELGIVFDWLNSSVALEVKSIPLLAVAIPVINELEAKALAAIKKVEDSIGA